MHIELPDDHCDAHTGAAMRINFGVSLTGSLCLGFAGLICSCTTAPRETVELSEIVGEQIVELQRSHEQFVSLYFDSLREDVDEFIRDRWIPTFYRNIVSGEGAGGAEFREQLDIAYILATLDWPATISVSEIDDPDVRRAVRAAIDGIVEEQSASLGGVLVDFAKAAQIEINKRRASLMEPIDKQEALILAELRATYADVQRGHATIEAYLGSVVDVVEQQDQIASKLAGEGARQRLLEHAAELSEQAASALEREEDALDAIDRFHKILGVDDN